MSYGCPINSKSGDLTYNDYLKIPELLTLQTPQSSPPHHDELLFIIIHQAYELWFKLVLHEIEKSMNFMGKGEVLRANHFLNRCVAIMKLLVKQIHILETMTPIEFLGFRDHLKPASGFQSLQFREIEFICGLKDESYFTYFQNRPEMTEKLKQVQAAKDLRQAYFELLEKQGFLLPKNATQAEASINSEDRLKTIQALLPIYQNPSLNYPLYLLSESLIELDETLSLWREHHVRVVERIIGFKIGTGGSSGVEYLKSTTHKKCFPSLWELRTHLEDVRK